MRCHEIAGSGDWTLKIRFSILTEAEKVESDENLKYQTYQNAIRLNV